MQADRSSRKMFPCFACLVAGLLLGSTGLEFASSRQPAATKPIIPFSMQERLGANLYVQTAAEYRACCLQVYKTAEMRLEAIMAAAHPKPLKPAVIMDLDETVLDNSAFESFLYENNLEYSDDLWEIYERDYPGEVRLVPGAKQFIKKAEDRGVTVIFISNRLEENCGSTVNALTRLGISTKGIGQRLLLKKRVASSDKTSRRETVAAQYNVLLVFGDNMRDFSETFIAKKLTENDGADAHDKAIASRLKLVDDATCHWGIDWFVLPNPGYGEWEKLIRNEPMKRLRPSGMKLRNAKTMIGTLAFARWRSDRNLRRRQTSTFPSTRIPLELTRKVQLTTDNGQRTVLLDSHAHLDDSDFDPDRAAVIERARAAGLRYILVAGGGTGPDRLDSPLAIAESSRLDLCLGGHSPARSPALHGFPRGENPQARPASQSGRDRRDRPRLLLRPLAARHSETSPDPANGAGPRAQTPHHHPLPRCVGGFA